MQAWIYTVLLVTLLGFLSMPATAQNEQSFQFYLQQGQRYEKQANYQKALDSYNKALTYSTETERKYLNQTVDRVGDLAQQQMLVNQARSDEVQRKIATLSSSQNRKRLQGDLTALQQRDDATQVDYQHLLQRVEAAKQAETGLNEEIVDNPVHKPTITHRITTTSKPGGPPPKSITVGMPGTAIKHQDKAAKSAGKVLNGSKKP